MLSIILVLALVTLLIFLLFSIIRGGFSTKNVNMNSTEITSPIPFKASFEEKVMEDYDRSVLQKSMEVQAVNEEVRTHENHSDISEPSMNEPAVSIPKITGQSDEQIVTPEPLQDKIDTKIDTNSALDPYENNDNTALFGSNLRHPEASFEKSSSKFASLENEIASGVASRMSSSVEMDKVNFSAEMAQNGGEFMSGIFAYDNSEEGTYFSSI
jgi:hypothetical protein